MYFLNEDGVGTTSLSNLLEVLKDAESELANIDFRLEYYSRQHFNVYQQVLRLKSQVELAKEAK